MQALIAGQYGCSPQECARGFTLVPGAECPLCCICGTPCALAVGVFQDTPRAGLFHTANCKPERDHNPRHVCHWSAITARLSGVYGITIVEVAAGEQHVLVRCTLGAVYSWGCNSDGQLGLGHTTEEVLEPSIIQCEESCCQVAAGSRHSLAVVTGGRLLAWGSSAHGQCARDFSTSISSPCVVQDFDQAQLKISAISAGTAHTVAITDSGDVYCFGDNEFGELGNNSHTSSATPQLVEALQEPAVKVRCN